jgi:hypothetical protein
MDVRELRRCGLNLVNSTLEVYYDPNFTGYTSTKVLHAGDQASPSKFPDVMIDVAELLAR